jgi:hypothetical protein
MISIIIATFSRFLLRYASPRYLLELIIKQHQEQEFQALKLCVLLYLWEEKNGIQHPHTMEDIAQVFDRKVEEVRLLYDILDYEHNMETLEKALSTKDVGLAFSI